MQLQWANSIPSATAAPSLPVPSPLPFFSKTSISSYKADRKHFCHTSSFLHLTHPLFSNSGIEPSLGLLSQNQINFLNFIHIELTMHQNSTINFSKVSMVSLHKIHMNGSKFIITKILIS